MEIRQHVLVDAANALYPSCLPVSKNCHVFGPAGAIMHYAAENDFCPYIKVKKLKEEKPKPRAMRKEDAARLIAAADGKLKLLLVFLFAHGWRISDALRLQWQDLDLKESMVRCHITKTDEWLEIPLHSAVLSQLRKEPPAQIGRAMARALKSLSGTSPALQTSRGFLHPAYGAALVCNMVRR